MSITIERLPERLHDRVIKEWRAGNKAYVLQTLKKHKVITCSSCANWSTISQWIEYAIEQKIWNEKAL